MPERRALSTTVSDVSWLTPSMVRVVVGGPDLEGFAVGQFTDHYVKCRFGDKCGPTPCAPGTPSAIC